MIQEALNENGDWKPIEYWVYSGCEDSYFDPLALEPGKYVIIPVRKYSGNFRTKIRLRFRKDNTVFYSESFVGNIDRSQFMEKTENMHYQQDTDETDPVVLK